MNNNTVVSETVKLTNTQAVEYLRFVQRNIQNTTPINPFSDLLEEWIHQNHEPKSN